MSDTDPQNVFRTESQELLETIEQGLLDLEVRPNDGEVVATVFRALHTLKGSGAMFGYQALAAFTHHCETVFDRVRKGDVAPTPRLIAAVLAALDHMRALAEEPDAKADGGEALLDRLRQAMEDNVASVPNSPPPTAWRIFFSLPADCLVNGTRPLVLLDELRTLGQAEITAVTDRIPPLDALVPTECHLGWEVRLITMQPRSAIEDVFLFVIDDMVLDIAEVTAERAANQPVLAAASVDRPAADKSEARVTVTTETVRVPATRLDELLDQVG